MNETQLIDERDEAEEAMSQAYYLVTGKSPEWSNLFGYEEALEEIGDAVSALKQAAKSAAVRAPDSLTEVRALSADEDAFLQKALIASTTLIPDPITERLAEALRDALPLVRNQEEVRWKATGKSTPPYSKSARGEWEAAMAAAFMLSSRIDAALRAYEESRKNET